MESVKYVKEFLSVPDANACLNEIMNYEFTAYPVQPFGRKYLLKMCMFGERDGLNYTFGKNELSTLAWNPFLLNLKAAVENISQASYNCVVLILQLDGSNKLNVCETLNSTTPTAILSLGATRTLHFTRKKYKSVKLLLENGSLLVMEPGNEKLWSHVLPAEPEVKDPRISLSFYNVDSPQPELSLNIEEMFVDEAMDTFFNSITPSQLDPSMCEPSTSEMEPTECEMDCTVLPTSINYQENRTVFKKNLGENVKISLELYKNFLKIHIRKYKMNENGQLYPTRIGVTMDIPTWYHFQQKMVNFNFCYVTTSFIANNNILVLNLSDYVHIQVLNVNAIPNQPFIRLQRSEICMLVDSLENINEMIINYLFNQQLTYFIQHKCKLVNALSSEEEDILILKLIECLENELNMKFRTVFECNGCIIDHPSQLQHACMTLTELEKYHCLGDNIFLLVNMEGIASNFVNSVDFISERFMSNISAHVIKDVVFKTK